MTFTARNAIAQLWANVKTSLTPTLSMMTSTWGSHTPTYTAAKYDNFVREGYLKCELIFACVNARASTTASVSLKVYDKKTHAELLDHPLRTLLEHPNPFISEYDFWRMVMINLDLAGMAPFQKVRDNAGRVISLWHLRPDGISMRRSPTEYLAGYTYSLQGATPIDLDRRDVLLFIERDPRDPLTPVSRAQVASRIIDVDNALTDYIKLYWEQGGTPMGVLTSKLKLSPDQITRARANWTARYGGAKNWTEPVVLDNDTTYQQIGTNFKDMGFADLDGRSEVRICTVMGVPPIIVGTTIGLGRNTFCLPAEARVMTLNGPRAIVDVQAGERVWSYVAGRLVDRQVTWSGQTGVKRVYKIRTKNRILKASDNHPVLTRIPGNSKGSNAERHATVAWKQVADLKPGDWIVQATSYPDQNNTVSPDGLPATEEMLQWLGAFIGDGCYTGGKQLAGLQLSIPAFDRTRCHYEDLTKRLFVKHTGGGIRAGRRIKDGSTEAIVALRDAGNSYRSIGEKYGLSTGSVYDRVMTVTRPVPERTAPCVIREVRFGFTISTAKDAARVYSYGFVRGAKNKRIPGWVFGLSESLRLAFIAGLVDTDGSIDKRGALSYTSASRLLIEDIKDLLLSIGIVSSNLSKVTIPASRLPQAGLYESYTAWTIVASSAHDVARIPFADPLYRERVESNTRRHKPCGRDAAEAGLNGLGFYRITAITELEEVPVYDLTVEDGHSFVADGVVVHNSNYEEARRAWWEDILAPEYKRLADQVNMDIVPEFGDDVYVKWDMANIPALREDQNARWARATAALVAGGITVNMFLTEIGKAVDDVGGDVYLRNTLIAAVPQNATDQADENEDPDADSNSKARGHLPVSNKADKTPPPGPALSQRIVAQYSAQMQVLAEQAAKGDLSAADFETQMQALIKQAAQAQAQAGGAISATDQARIDQDVQEQFKYLDGFVRAIGDLSPEAAQARADMYARSARSQYWKQACPVDLPIYPGDGQTNCKTACDCYLEIDTESKAGACLVTWQIGNTNTPCSTCAELARTWRPLEVAMKKEDS